VKNVKSIYIAGPLESAIDGDFNFPAFDRVAQQLRDKGHYVYSPADHARGSLGSLEDILAMSPFALKKARRKILAEELYWLCSNAHLVVLLPGWEKSPGARAERAAAEALGIEIELAKGE
jgi:Domain of unknown function (DUF4406)